MKKDGKNKHWHTNMTFENQVFSLFFLYSYWIKSDLNTCLFLLAIELTM